MNVNSAYHINNEIQPVRFPDIGRCCNSTITALEITKGPFYQVSVLMRKITILTVAGAGVGGGA